MLMAAEIPGRNLTELVWGHKVKCTGGWVGRG